MKHFLLFAAALAASAPADAQRRRPAPPPPLRLTVTMTNRGFVPRLVNLRHGRTYLVRLVNASDRGHDFSAPDLFDAARARPVTAARFLEGRVDLDPGEAATIRLRVPNAPGRFPFKSTHVADAASGLSGYAVIR